MKKLLLGLGAYLLVVPLVIVMLASTASSAAANVGCGAGGGGQRVQGVKLDAEQMANAQTIVATTRALNLPGYAAVVAVATAMQESSLHNDLRQLDHDSIGLFQQRISIYGAEVAGDPVKSTTAFLARLVQVPNWQTIPLTQAAQAVQISATPDAYAKWQSLAQDLVQKMWPGATVAACDGSGPGNDVGGGIPPGFALPSDVQQATAVAFALAQLGKPYVFGAEGPDSYDCSGLMMAAWAAAGVNLPRTTFDQVNVGVAVPNVNSMQPGDLIFIPGSDGTVEHPGHVGMYIGRGGDGQQYLVQAPHTGDVVKVSPVSTWGSQIVSIRRPLTHRS